MTNQGRSRTGKLQQDAGKLVAAKNKLLQKRSRGLAEVRANLPPRLFTHLIAWLNGLPAIAKQIIHPPFPRGWPDLKRAARYSPVALPREISWASALLQSQAAELKIYCEQRRLFDRAFVLGEYTRCNDVLEEIEHQLGVSLWLAKHRIAVLQASQGLDAQKKFASSIRKMKIPGNLVAYLAHHVSARNEPSVSPSRFESQYLTHLRASSMPAEFRLYLQFHMLPRLDLSLTEAETVLRYESSGAAIDLYETLLAIAPTIYEAGGELRETVVRALTPLEIAIEDPRLSAFICRATARNSDLGLSKPVMAAISELLSGRPNEAISLARSGLHDCPTCPVSLETTALCEALQPAKTLQESTTGAPIERIVVHLARLLRHDPDEGEAITALLKYRLNLAGASWADLLEVVVRRETSDDVVASDDPRIRRQTMLLPGANPLWIDRIAPAERPAYAKVIIQLFSDSPHVTSYARLRALDQAPDLLLELPQSASKTLLEAELAYENGKYLEAIAFARDIQLSLAPVYKLRAARVECRALLSAGHIEQCVRRLVSVVLSHQQSTDLLPIEPAVAALDRQVRRHLASSLELAILLHLYGLAGYRDRENERADACEDFLTSQGLAKPSELRERLASFDHDQLVFFLRYVCVEPVLDLFTTFEKSREVREERIEICKLLTMLDPVNTGAYQDEIRELLRILMIQQRTREIEQSKIHVDTESIRRNADPAIRESFNRLKAFIQEGRGVTALPAFAEVLERVLARSTGDVVIYLELPQDEVYDLFETLVLRLRDEYVSNTEHGLDGYLSVKIRHGTLTGQLRKPLEDGHLITQKNSSTGVYRRNEHWRSQIKPCAKEVADAIEARLFAFAQSFDDLVHKMLREWIQVRRNPEEKGLFDFALESHSIRALASIVTPDMTFEEFVDGLFVGFGEVLDRSLSRVRVTFEEQAKPRINEMLTSLEVDLDNFADRADISALSNAVRVARTDMQFAFDRIIEWFRRGRTAANEPFAFEDAVAVAEASARTVAPTFRARLAPGLNADLRIPGALLPIYDDILFLVFENIASRSGVSSPLGDISWIQQGEVLHVRVENDVAPEAADERARARVNSIREGVQEGRFRGSVAREGGTGLYKLHKLLSYDLGVEPRLDFGFASVSRFYVEFELVTLLRRN
jgi:hypothetical protein